MTTLRQLHGPSNDSVVGIGVQPDTNVLVVELFEIYHKAIFAYIFRLVGDRDSAHDLTQETFLRLFRARHRLLQIKNPRAWLYRIATNVAFNVLKRRRRFAWLPWHDSDAAKLAAPDSAEAADRRTGLEQALAQLPPHYRAPLLLHSHYGFSIREVAEALDLSEGAVKTRLYRAREMFRRWYDER